MPLTPDQLRLVTDFFSWPDLRAAIEASPGLQEAIAARPRILIDRILRVPFTLEQARAMPEKVRDVATVAVIAQTPALMGSTRAFPPRFWEASIEAMAAADRERRSTTLCAPTKAQLFWAMRRLLAPGRTLFIYSYHVPKWVKLRSSDPYCLYSVSVVRAALYSVTNSTIFGAYITNSLPREFGSFEELEAGLQ